MKYDDTVNGKVYRFFEKLYQLIILNLITILISVLGLGIFTIMPSLVALNATIKELDSDNQYPFLKSYFLVFKNNYLKVFLLSLIYLAIGVVLVFNTYFFYSAAMEFKTYTYFVLYYLMLAVDIYFLFVYINASLLFVYFPHLKNIKVLKYSFTLFKIIPLKAILMSIMLLILVILIYIAPIVVLIILISLYSLIFVNLVRNEYNRLLPEGYKSIDISEYITDYNNKRKRRNS